MLMYILIGVAVLLVLLIVVVAMQPKEMRVSRSTTISARVDRVFANVNDLHAWEAWSPWQKIDPNCKQTYAGPHAGAGSSMAWEGNKQVGAGKMTIMESRPSSALRMKLEFMRPFKATNAAGFDFKQQGAQTNVEWSMTCQRNFFFKLMGMVCNMDKMIGKDFEKGLSQMKDVVENKQPVGAA